MTKLEQMAQKYVNAAFIDPEDSFAEKCAATSGFKEGFFACRSMVLEELTMIAGQTDDPMPIWMLTQFDKLGEREI